MTVENSAGKFPSSIRSCYPEKLANLVGAFLGRPN
jgi:hypothetical protein